MKTDVRGYEGSPAPAASSARLSTPGETAKRDGSAEQNESIEETSDKSFAHARWTRATFDFFP